MGYGCRYDGHRRWQNIALSFEIVLLSSFFQIYTTYSLYIHHKHFHSLLIHPCLRSFYLEDTKLNRIKSFCKRHKYFGRQGEQRPQGLSDLEDDLNLSDYSGEENEGELGKMVEFLDWIAERARMRWGETLDRKRAKGRAIDSDEYLSSSTERTNSTPDSEQDDNGRTPRLPKQSIVTEHDSEQGADDDGPPVPPLRERKRTVEPEP